MQLPHFFDAPNAPHYDARFFNGRVPPASRHHILADLVRVLQNWSESCSVQTILAHGGLLGHFLCEGSLLPWEDNLDFILAYDDLLKLAASAPGPFDLCNYEFDLNPNHRTRSSFNAHSGETREANRIDARLIDRRTGLYLDLTALTREGGRLSTKCPHRWHESELYPLLASTLMDVPVWIPNEFEKILRAEYGDLDRIARELPVLDYLRSMVAAPPPSMPEFAGRGIVTSGSDRYLPYLCALVASLRLRGCPLPIEVWHRASELSPASIEALGLPGVVCRVLDSRFQTLPGFACKPAAMVASHFAEILFLDADNSALADPSFLFDHPDYVQTGALLWPDNPFGIRRQPEFRRMLELPPGYSPVESGQLVLDKRRCWRGLNLALELNRAAAVTYRFMGGDKDTFAIGFELAGDSFKVLPFRPRLEPDGSLRHFSPDLLPLFLHRGAGQAKFDFVLP